MIVTVRKILERFMKKLQKTDQTREDISDGKAMIIHLIVEYIKLILYKMSQCFPKPYETFGQDISVKGDLSNHTTKADLKKGTGVDTSNLAAKSDLASSKDEVGKTEKSK